MEAIIEENMHRPGGNHAVPTAQAVTSAGRHARIIGVGTATSSTAYSQDDVLNHYGIEDRRTRAMFREGSIGRRFLTVPELDVDGVPRAESQGDLLKKHREVGLLMGGNAVKACLQSAGKSLSDIGHLCCVTTTGLLTPGLSALLCRELGLRRECARLDIVGMGCNAGLNGLNAVTSWAQGHPGQLAVMVCVEVCSAAYVIDDSIRSAVVNSLFGDGAAATAVICGGEVPWPVPTVMKFRSVVVPEAIDAMRFDWDEHHGKFNFFLERDVPYVVGANVEQVVAELLEDTGVRASDVTHWIVHSGGKKVIDAIKVNLGLSQTDLRHTSSVLRDFGNVSSGSFLFSYERLVQEGVVNQGDIGVMITMGPGTTIETALLKWN